MDFLLPGSYSVTVKDSLGCQAFSNTILITDIELRNEDHIYIYPNPLITGNWHINFSDLLVGSEVQLYDASGRIVYTSIVQTPHAEVTASLESGVYFMRINTGTNVIVKRLVHL
jgi:hypothetical protein